MYLEENDEILRKRLIRLAKKKAKWRKVLLKLFTFPYNLIGKKTNDANKTDFSHLARALRMKNDDLNRALMFLKIHKLVEEYPTKIKDNNKSFTELILTRKGFDIAFELDKHRENFFLTVTSLNLFLILAFTGVWRMLYDLFNFSNYINLLTMTLSILIIIIGNIIFIKTYQEY